jgi:hypothetical protein
VQEAGHAAAHSFQSELIIIIIMGNVALQSTSNQK